MEPTPHQNSPDASQSGVRAALGKRTFATQDAPQATVPTAAQGIQVAQANPSKRARAIGPSCARPMPLQLPSDGEIVGSPGSVGVPSASGKQRLERTLSYYPNRGDYTHPLASLDPETLLAHNLDPNDEGIENEDDWMEAEQPAEVTRKMSAKTVAALESERPSWQGAHTINVLGVDLSAMSGHGSSAVPTPRNPPLLQLEPEVPTAGLSAMATTLRDEVPGVTPDFLEANWPAETDLVLAAGATKPLLTNQKPLVHSVVRDAIENMQAMLMFNHAFPDSALSWSFAKECLITAAEKQAEKHKLVAAVICSRLQQDTEYLTMLNQLPRARIPLLRSDVKERCNTLCMGEILAIGSASDIAKVIHYQTSDYTYTFPTAAKNGPLSGLVRRTRPYRNKRIILVIRDLFFTGGDTSFASCFGHLFPVHQDRDCVLVREVPVPMVALVSTALYASLYEWRTGKQQSNEFSANTYLDVYKGHVDTFKVIKEQRPAAYHVMMADIYAQASAVPEDAPGIPVANIDFHTLEE